VAAGALRLSDDELAVLDSLNYKTA
jgi:hypothetical protein